MDPKIERAAAIQGHIVHVAIPAEIAYDLQKMTKVTANVLGSLGCPGCHSGFDIRFVQVRDFIVDPHSLDVKAATLGG